MHNHKDTVSMDASGAQWDVFIAYYGDDRNGTQKQAEILYDRLNGFYLRNGHALRVYQHTRCNRNGLFCETPDIVASSRMLLLIADSKIPTEANGSLRRLDGNGCLKRLYEEVNAFRQSPFYRAHHEEEACCVIRCGDMSYEAAERLNTIFNGRVSRHFSEENVSDFTPLLEHISGYLIGDSTLLTLDVKKETPPVQPKTISATRGEIPIGSGARERLLSLHGQRAPYERLAVPAKAATSEDSFSFLQFSEPLTTPFVPDAEMFADCEKIVSGLEAAEHLTEEESVFLRFIHDIQEGRKESRLVTRICSIDSISPYGRLMIQTQPIEYLWIMKMTMLDTPYRDGNEMTTLRRKYANPVEESESFVVADRLSCHCGCGVFIVTSDGYLVCQDRFEAENNRVSFFPGKLSYTVSGSYLFGNGSVSDFMNEKMDVEIGNLIQDLYLWEFGYEYDYLHYQFSFFSFCEETKEEFIECTQPRSAQAKGFVFYDLRDEAQIASVMQMERWESSAWAVLNHALMSNQFARLLNDNCGIAFNRRSFISCFPRQRRG